MAPLDANSHPDAFSSTRVGFVAELDPHAFPRSVYLGDQVANASITAAAERHLEDLDRDDIYFDDREWEAYASLVQKLQICDGHELSGSAFTLLPWQSWVVGSMLCWRYRDDNRRRYRTGFVEVARGAGKTTLAATLLLHAAFQTNGGDIVCLANTVQQARLSYDAACKMGALAFGDTNSDDDDAADGLLRVTERKLLCVPTGATVRPYASKTNTLDGLRAVAYIVDETAEAKTDFLAKIISALSKLSESYMLSISTPGGVEGGRDSVYYRRRLAAVEALKRPNWHRIDTFGALFGLDELDDMTDEREWIKAQPSLGHVIPISAYRRQLEEYKAQNDLASFERFQCCRYSTKGMHWVSGDLWERNEGGTNDYPRDPDTPIWCAVDLSKSFDVSSAAWGWWENGKLVVRWHHWIIDRGDKSGFMDYQRNIDAWSKLPNVTVCEHSVQYESVKARLWDIKRAGDLRCVGFDRIGGQKTEIQSWGERGKGYNRETDLPMEPTPQTIVTLGPATFLIESMLRSDQLQMQACPVVQYCLANVVLEENTNGDRRPTKAKSRGIIDPVVALIMLGANLIADGATQAGAYADPTDIAI